MIQAYRKAKTIIDESIKNATLWAQAVGASHYYVAGNLDRGYDAANKFMDEAFREMWNGQDMRRIGDRELAKKALYARLATATEKICTKFRRIAA